MLWISLDLLGGLRSQRDVLAFVRQRGGKVYFEGEHGVEGFANQSTSPPSVFSKQNVVFVDMVGTRFDDSHVPRLVELINRLPSAMFLDVRRTQVSVNGLKSIVDSAPALGLIADEEKIRELDIPALAEAWTVRGVQ